MYANRFLSELDISIFKMFMAGSTRVLVMATLEIKISVLEERIRNINRTILIGSNPKYWPVDQVSIYKNFNAQIEYQQDCEKLHKKKMSKFTILD